MPSSAVYNTSLMPNTIDICTIDVYPVEDFYQEISEDYMPDGRELGIGRNRRHLGIMGFLRPALLFLLTRENSHGYSLLEGVK